MNVNKLKQAQHQFFEKYPNGFMHPEMQAVGKKHKMDKMTAMAQDAFKKSRFKDPEEVCEAMIKIVTRSSMVSMFEKPKFRDYVRGLSEQEKRQLSNGLKKQLHGNKEKGFNEILEILRRGKLAKWSLITIIPNYFYPDDEVFVKPTTAKGVINYFELQDLVYKPAPSWDFYQRYGLAIDKMKSLLEKDLAPSNAAFCGFLMMNMHG